MIAQKSCGSLEEALDNEPYPNIRCPFGCWCFIEEKGHISFQHLLNYVCPCFTSFSASFTQHLRGVNISYFEPIVALNEFVVSGSCRVHSTLGLVIQTCAEHSGGSPVQFIHPPEHPKLKRVACLYQERIGLVVPSLMSVVNTKANYASHTFQLVKSFGSFSGVSSIRLTPKRNWDKTSDALHHAEGMATFFRQDIQILIRNWVKDGFIVDDIAQSLLSYQPDLHASRSELHKSSHVDLKMSCVMSENLNACVDESLSAAVRIACYTLAHGVDSHGAHALMIVSDCSDVLWLVQLICAFSDKLRSEISSPSRSTTADLLCVFLSSVLLPKTRNTGLATVMQLLEQHLIEVLNSRQHIPTDRFICAAVILGSLSASFRCRVLRNRKLSWQTMRDVKCQYVLFSTDCANSSRTRSKLPMHLTLGSRQYEVVAVGRYNSKQKPLMLLRYGHSYSKFWLFEKNKRFPEKIFTTAQEAYDDYIGGYWNFIVYSLVHTSQIAALKMRYLSNITGQGVFFCAQHDNPLTRDFPKNGFFVDAVESPLYDVHN